MGKKVGRPPGKKYERTVTIQLTEEQWERIDLEAIVMRVPFAEAVRMNLEVALNNTNAREETNNA